VLEVEGSSKKSKGFFPTSVLNESRVGRICSFWPISYRISETVQDMANVAISDL